MNTPHRSFAVHAVLFAGLLLGLLTAACGESDTFPCGTQGGTCQTASELCLLNDGCSTCVPLPTGCETELVCGCASDAEMAAWDTPCTDLDSCDDTQAGLTLDCPSQEWGCG